MSTKRPKKALLEVIPPRICVTFRRGSFWFRPKTSKMRIWKPRPENTTNTVSGSRPDFSEKSENHENRLELDPYSTSRAENQAIWSLKVLWIQWDPSGTPKLPYKIQNRLKIQWIPPGTVYIKLFRQPYWEQVCLRSNVWTYAGRQARWYLMQIYSLPTLADLLRGTVDGII